ncbi:MAG: PhoPQ-activated pathogenicity-related family protein [Planctomycetota bacterium]
MFPRDPLPLLMPLVAVLVALVPVTGQEPTMVGMKAVQEYVNHPDPAYDWNVVRKRQTQAGTAYVVELASQRWRTQEEVNRTLWKHWLLVTKPETVAFDKAFLMIGGGSNNESAPSGPSDTALRLAAATKSVVAELKMVPNQPLIFHGDGIRRKEDDLIGYAWDRFLRSHDKTVQGDQSGNLERGSQLSPGAVKAGDVTWLPRLPMVKSAVRAMDCVEELMASKAGGEVGIDGFVVAGGSKRGWTTWMTAVADSRVEAIVPIVIDVLNIDPSMRHHAAAYGFWAEAIGDYVRHGITERWSDPAMDQLYAVVDPFRHRRHLSMPKFIVNACGDEFFCPDSSRFYFADLPGEKYLRYVPNAGHSLDGTDALESITAFYLSLLKGQPRPRFAWSFEPDGAIRVETEDRPRRVLLWQATNPNARDFRVTTIGRAFSSRELADQGGGVYVGEVASPKQGWTAYLVELTYDLGGPVPLKLTTAVRVTPNTLPHAGIDPSEVPSERRRSKRNR